MQETLYQTEDAAHSLSDSGCRRISIRQWMQVTLYQTADAGDSIRRRMQKSPFQTADAGDSPSDS